MLIINKGQFYFAIITFSYKFGLKKFICQTMVKLKTGKVLRFTLFFILLILLCDWYIFPLLFSNIVHSRYFSLRCGNENEPSCNELDKLFLNRYTNCKEKANRYWMNQPRKLNTKSIVYDGLNRYWSKQMIEFLGAKYLVLWSSRSLKMRELSFSQFWGKWFIFHFWLTKFTIITNKI